MILTTEFKKHIAKQIINSDLMLAWGTGDLNWRDEDFSAQSQADANELVNEIGRRLLLIKSFAVADDNGEIQLPHGCFSATTTESDTVYLRCLFEYEDEPTAVIREYGVFANAKTANNLPAGQQYFTPAQVTEKGQMISYSRLRTPIYRTADTRQTVEIIIPIMQMVI